VKIYSFFTFGVSVGGRWSMPNPRRFTPGIEPQHHCTGGWKGNGVVLDRQGKFLSPTYGNV